jgi:integrase
VKHLRTKGFGSQDPLFPRSKLTQGEDSLSFQIATEVEPIFWKGTGRIRDIFKKRAEAAGLRYHPPHSFRHLAVELALKYCNTGEQFKAISQNFGHDHVATTISSYANYNPQKLSHILKSMDFSGEPLETLEEKLDALREMIKKSLTDK